MLLRSANILKGKTAGFTDIGDKLWQGELGIKTDLAFLPKQMQWEWQVTEMVRMELGQGDPMARVQSGEHSQLYVQKELWLYHEKTKYNLPAREPNYEYSCTVKIADVYCSLRVPLDKQTMSAFAQKEFYVKNKFQLYLQF